MPPSSEGAPDRFFPPPFPFSPFSGGICCFIRAGGSHQSAYFFLQMRSGAGQLPAEKRGPSVTSPRGLLTPVSLFLSLSFPHSSHLWAKGPKRSKAYLRGHLAVWGGGEISFTRAPVIRTVTNEACPVTSTDERPWAVLGVPVQC